MSEQYIVSARKYRPATFHSVVGQKALTSTLKNAIDSDRLAQAYLFTGPRGVGKTSCARIFARTINCLSRTPDGEACGVCDSCRAMADGNSFNIIELDAASNNSVDDIRNITEQVNIPPQVGRYRVFIIDEVHMLSSAAFNAFLKTLEEPPKYVIFILATTEKHKVIPTILSRCQIYDFKRITISDMVEHLRYVASQEGIEAEPSALNVIARKADGAMRDALSIFDQVAASSRGKITYESTVANLNVLDYDYYFRLVEAFRAADVGSALLLYKEIRDKGFDSQFFVSGLASHIRDLMVAADPRTLPLLEVAEDVAGKYTEQARTLPVQWYYAAMRLLNDCDLNYKVSSGKQLLVELTLVRLCQLLDPPKPPFDRLDDEPPLQQPMVAMRQAPAPSAPQSVPRQAYPQQGGVGPSAPVQTTQQTSQQAPQQVAPAQPASPQSPAMPRQQIAAPAQAPPSASASGRRSARGGMRLSDIKASVGGGAAERPKLREPVSQEAINQAWMQFIVDNPEKRMLVSAMRNGMPERVSEEGFRTTVDHPALQQAYEIDMTNLLSYLREKTRNDFITLEVKVDAGEIVKKLPAHELLQKIVEKNPAMAQLLSNLDAEME